MSFGKSKEIKKLPRSRDILNCVTDLEIFEYYLGSIPTRPISSPLREDTKPSFSLFHSRNHDMILFKDFATGEVGDCFVFVMRLFNLGSKIESFNRVANDFHLNQFELDRLSYPLPTRRRTKAINTSKVREALKGNQRLKMAVTVRDWKIKDKKYWYEGYGLNKDQLEFCNIFPISHYFINGYCTVADELAYAFVEHKDGVQTFKIYQPHSGDRKWINNNDFSTWELWTQMPQTGDKLIITSSRKDAIVIKSLFSSQLITSCSLQSEGVIPKESVIEELRGRFKEIYILYDNDSGSVKNPGREAGRKLADQTGFKQIEIPDSTGTKDISDYRYAYGAEKTKNIILKLIKQSNNI